MRLDYLALVDPDTFEETGEDYAGPARLLVAARIGATRLIDNIPLSLESHAATIDVGNTNTVLGMFDGDEIVEHWRINTDPDRTADEIAVLLAACSSTVRWSRTRT